MGLATPPRIVTVLIDNREKFPLLFPRTVVWNRRGRKAHTFLLRTKKQRLTAGDYALAGYDDALVERKGSLRELSNNLFSDDRRRSDSAFHRLVAATPNPYLLMDLTLGELMTATEHVLDAKIIVDELLDKTRSTGLKLLIVGGCKAAGARRLLGEFVVRLLLAHAMNKEVPAVDIVTMMNNLTTKGKL